METKKGDHLEGNCIQALYLLPIAHSRDLEIKRVKNENFYCIYIVYAVFLYTLNTSKGRALLSIAQRLRGERILHWILAIVDFCKFPSFYDWSGYALEILAILLFLTFFSYSILFIRRPPSSRRFLHSSWHVPFSLKTTPYITFIPRNIKQHTSSKNVSRLSSNCKIWNNLRWIKLLGSLRECRCYKKGWIRASWPFNSRDLSRIFKP